MRHIGMATCLAALVLTSGATHDGPVVTRMPGFGKSCISNCFSCAVVDGDERMAWTTAATNYNSLLDGFASCSSGELGPCSTFGNCDEVWGAALAQGTIETPEALQQTIWASAESGDLDGLRAMMRDYPDLIQYNPDREAMQLVDCSGDGIMMSVPVRARGGVTLIALANSAD